MTAANVASVLVPLEPSSDRFTIYDNALIVMLRLRTNRREEAGQILAELARRQRPDGSLWFSGSLKSPDDGADFVRAGAVAWVGYAAAVYLNNDPSGTERPAIAAMAQKIATYLLAHQITDVKDARFHLITGGFGTYTHAIHKTGVSEDYVPGPVAWVSTEHNIDAYFFFRSMQRLTGDQRFATAAAGIGKALVDKLWHPALGQFRQGLSVQSVDKGAALDCASWGALFLLAYKDRPRAMIALKTAEQRYASSAHQVKGHRPYALGPLVEPQALAAFVHQKPSDWRDVAAVWPEGSAGVALAAWRLGEEARAKEILTELDKLRGKNGSLPDLTEKVPFSFSGGDSVASTTWVALVKEEMAAPARQALWFEP